VRRVIPGAASEETSNPLYGMTANPLYGQRPLTTYPDRVISILVFSPSTPVSDGPGAGRKHENERQLL
jgi:hypothetical protein